ncbi:MAG: hypothetical protein R3B95_16905 [Nitrospirales bacterium]|nr:hypothetical protein [Nitrospirales bacterium]
MALLERKKVCDWGRAAISTIFGVLLVLLFEMPVIADGKESTTTEGGKESEAHQSNKADSDSTFSDVMGWARRFGNRVGDNISEAAGKTASAIKKATSENKPKSQSEDNP